MSGIYLSDKHGVNPSVTHCFFCGESIGLALFGRLPNDAEAPHATILDMDPCDRCKGVMQQGVLFVIVPDGSYNNIENQRLNWAGHVSQLQPGKRSRARPFVPQVKRLGLVGLREEAVLRMGINPPELLQQILAVRWTFLEAETAKMLGILNEDNSLPEVG